VPLKKTVTFRYFYFDIDRSTPNDLSVSVLNLLLLIMIKSPKHSIRPLSIATAVSLFSALGLSAQLNYSWHFNLDENLPGAENPIADTGWDFYYGSNATVGSYTDPNLRSGNSEGATSGAKFDTTFENGNRGFMFASGAPGFTPGGFLFTSTDLATTDVIQGGKTSGTIQDTWNAPSIASTYPLATRTVGDLISINAVVNPRNAATRYHFAFQADGNWYVDSVGFSGVTSWTAYNWTPAGSTVIELPFIAGSSLDLDLSDNVGLSFAALDQSAAITGYGMYVDTDSLTGTSDSWARMDALVVEAVPEPSSYAMIAGLVALGGMMLRRRLS
jgi:hypothetical protein